MIRAFKAKPSPMGYLRIAAVVLATIIMLTIVLMVAAVFIGFFRMSEYNARYSTVRTPRYKISDLYSGLKTGDLVLFVATTHAPANSILTQTFHSHAGILLREGELVYIAEAQPALELMPCREVDSGSDAPGADYRMRRGADIVPLLTRLKYYTGAYYVLRLSHELDPAREEGLKRGAERLRRERYPYPTMMQIILGLFGWKTPSRHCFQHVAYLLDEARLTPLDREGLLRDAGFSDICGEICEISGAALPDGYTYHPPVQIIYDIGVLDPLPARQEAQTESYQQ